MIKNIFKTDGIKTELAYLKQIRPLSYEELLNRDYYRGRFASFSKQNKRQIFNWDEASI